MVIRRSTPVRFALTLVIVCLAGLVIAPPTLADEAITTQAYVEPFKLAEMQAQGLDGSGVTIAVIDGALDASVPELEGADITSNSFCPFTHSAESISHGTAVVSLIASKYYGWAPRAKILHYAVPAGDDVVPAQCEKDGTDGLFYSINRALDDGADIISISLGSDFEVSPANAYAVVRATDMNVPVVIAAGNDKETIYGTASLNGTIGVGSTNLNGVISGFSNYGEGLTVMAPGENITARDVDSNGNLTVITPDHKGTSYSTPMVTGLLALGMQKYPDATGNQLIRTLIKTSTSGSEWRKDRGWGLIQREAFLNTDPSGEEDTNPLMEKVPFQRPTPEDIANVHDGLISIWEMGSTPTYTYRGDYDSEVVSDPAHTQFGTSPRYRANLPAPVPAWSDEKLDPFRTSNNSLIVGGGIGAAVVVVFALIAVFAVKRSRKAKAVALMTPPAGSWASYPPPYPHAYASEQFPAGHIPQAPEQYPYTQEGSPEAPPQYPYSPGQN